MGIKLKRRKIEIVNEANSYTEEVRRSIKDKYGFKKLKFSKILFGFRGKKVGDIDSLINTILKLANFADKTSNNISEVDINPLIICEKGKGVFAADALIHYFE